MINPFVEEIYDKLIQWTGWVHSASELRDMKLKRFETSQVNSLKGGEKGRSESNGLPNSNEGPSRVSFSQRTDRQL